MVEAIEVIEIYKAVRTHKLPDGFFLASFPASRWWSPPAACPTESTSHCQVVLLQFSSHTLSIEASLSLGGSFITLILWRSLTGAPRVTPIWYQRAATLFPRRPWISLTALSILDLELPRGRGDCVTLGVCFYKETHKYVQC